MKYKLMVSYNVGVNYECEGESDNLSELAEKGEEFDKKTLRWVVEDEDGCIVVFSNIHRSIFENIERKRAEEKALRKEDKNESQSRN